jgi:hypothetical protein
MGVKKMSNKETLEEAAERIYPNGCDGTDRSAEIYRRILIEGAKWQAQKMYSEEDVCDFVEWINLHYRSLEHTVSFKDARGTKELLQQFKKQNNEQ